MLPFTTVPTVPVLVMPAPARIAKSPADRRLTAGGKAETSDAATLASMEESFILELRTIHRRERELGACGCVLP